jgi:hypothetical protein
MFENSIAVIGSNTNLFVREDSANIMRNTKAKAAITLKIRELKSAL